jgi:hypothetical protein
VKPSHAARNIALARNTRKKLQPYIVGSYINVPDQGIKNSGPIYYGRNFPRLKRVKAKYDPKMYLTIRKVFHQLNGIVSKQLL